MNSDELILRYLMGSASEDEVRELEVRLRESEELQDEYLRQSQLDAYLRQEAQSVADECSPKAPVANRSEVTPNVWKWATGISTLTATVLLSLLILSLPPQESAMAYPSLGDMTAEVSRVEYNIWASCADGDLIAVRSEVDDRLAVNARSEFGLTPLHAATLFDQTAVVELLLQHGADPSLTDAEGNTALHMAAFLGHANVVRVLLAHKGNPSVRNELGFSSMDLVSVVWSPGLESFYRGLEAELNIDVDLVKVRAERPRILKLLVAADDSEAGVAPGTSVIQAAITGNTAAIEQHIVAGTDLNQTEDVGGSTPLMLAAIFEMRDVARILIDAGVNLEVRNKTGGTVLHTACFFGRPEIVRLLLSAGADTNQVNNRGLTPLETVTIEFDAESQGAYRHVYESLGLPFDAENIRRTRSQIAHLLRSHDSETPRVPDENSNKSADRNRTHK